MHEEKNLEKECWMMMARGGLEKASEDSELPIMRLDVLCVSFFDVGRVIITQPTQKKETD